MCQVRCSSIQGIYARFGDSSGIGICALSICIEICHDVCLVWCSGVEGIYD